MLNTKMKNEGGTRINCMLWKSIYKDQIGLRWHLDKKFPQWNHEIQRNLLNDRIFLRTPSRTILHTTILLIPIYLNPTMEPLCSWKKLFIIMNIVKHIINNTNYLINVSQGKTQATCTFPINKLNILRIMINVPEGMCVMDMILPPIQGTTLRFHSPFFSSMGVLESSVPLGPETSSTSGIGVAFSAKKKLQKVAHLDIQLAFLGLLKACYIEFRCKIQHNLQKKTSSQHPLYSRTW